MPSAPPTSTTGRAGALAAVAAAVAVGSVAPSQIKSVLETLPPLALAAGRVGFSALAFTVVVLAQPWRRRPVEPRDRLAVLGCGLGGSAGFHLLYTWGQARVSVAVAAVILGCMPVVVAGLEVAFLRHRLGRLQLLGLLLSVAGVTVMSLGPQGGAGPDLRDPAWIAGALAVAGAVAAWSGVTVATRSLADRYDPWWLNTPGTVLGALVMLALVAAGGDLPRFGDLDAVGWAQVAWLGAVSSAFLYAALAAAMRHLHATTVASLTTLITPLSGAVAWVALGERPHATVLAGGAVVVLGALLVTLPQPVTAAPVAAPVGPPGQVGGASSAS